MDKKQIDLMKNGRGFIAAMDQSGGSTPGALADYGIKETEYETKAEMFELVQAMRTRVITSPSFSSDYILGAILFKHTMNNKMEGKYTAEYLWQEKGILPILKVDQQGDRYYEFFADQKNWKSFYKSVIILFENKPIY